MLQSQKIGTRWGAIPRRRGTGHVQDSEIWSGYQAVRASHEVLR
jgi:hypothetical protein